MTLFSFEMDHYAAMNATNRVRALSNAPIEVAVVSSEVFATDELGQRLPVCLIDGLPIAMHQTCGDGHRSGCGILVGPDHDTKALNNGLCWYCQLSLRRRA